MLSRFVAPDTATLTISRGDTLTVKRRLNAGEARARLTRMTEPDDAGGRRINPMQVGPATITAYLLDWTITNNGQPMPLRDLSIAEREAVLDNLDPDDFGEILRAIQAHEAAMQAEREADQKKTGTMSSPSSGSLAAAGGGMNG